MTSEFSTTDIYLSSYLNLKGFIYSRLEKQPSITIFYYETHADLSSAIDQYYSKKANVEPISFYKEVKRVKQLNG